MGAAGVCIQSEYFARSEENLEATAMNEATVIERLLELAENAGSSTTTSDEGSYLPDRLGKNPSLVDALDHLRLQGNYLRFDLEATHRENRYLRLMLEGRSKTDIDGESNA